MKMLSTWLPRRTLKELSYAGLLLMYLCLSYCSIFFHFFNFFSIQLSFPYILVWYTCHSWARAAAYCIPYNLRPDMVCSERVGKFWIRI
jgi:hypothetical protein